MVLENILGCLVENTHLVFEKKRFYQECLKKQLGWEGRHPNTAQWTHIVGNLGALARLLAA